MQTPNIYFLYSSNVRYPLIRAPQELKKKLLHNSQTGWDDPVKAVRWCWPVFIRMQGFKRCTACKNPQNMNVTIFFGGGECSLYKKVFFHQ